MYTMLLIPASLACIAALTGSTLLGLLNKCGHA